MISFLTLDMPPCSQDRGNVVGIATRYGLEGPGSECRWGEIFRTRLNRPWGPPSLLHNEYRAIPGGKAVWAWG